MSASPIEVILDRLEGKLNKGKYYSARCPAHADKEPSLSIREAPDRRVLLKCHAGCSVPSILSAIGLEQRDLFSHNGHVQTEPWEHRYRGADNKKRGIKVRNPGKRIAWSESLPEKLPYELPKLQKGILGGNVVYLCNGEKAVEAMIGLGYCATCSPDGEANWPAELNRYFRGADVVIVADQDKAGMTGAYARYRSLRRIANSIRIVRSRTEGEGHDAYDHLQAGFTASEFVTIKVDDLRSGEERDPLVVSLDQVVREEIDWLWYPFFSRGQITMLDGEKDLGKSYFGQAVAVGLSCGYLPGCDEFEPQRTLILAAEDSLTHTIKDRIMNFPGADERMILAIDEFRGSSPFPNFDAGGIDRIHKIMDREEITLVIFDMLFSYIGGIEMNSDSEAKAIMRELHHMLRDVDGAAMALRHPTKPNGKQQDQHKGLGSQGWLGSCRLGLFCDKNSERGPMSRQIRQIKNNLAPRKGDPILFRFDPVERFLWDGFGNEEGERTRGPKADARERAEKALVAILTRGAGLYKNVVAEVMDMATVGEATVHRARKSLAGMITTEGSYWGLTANIDDPDPFGEEPLSS